MRERPYALGPAAREALLGAVSLPHDLRVEVLDRLHSDIGRAGFVEAFAQFIAMANSVVENNREMVELTLVCEGQMHPHSAEKVNLPTMFGALFGLKIADGIDESLVCYGCAFRVGTPANQSPATTCDADYCAEPGEPDFLCHAEGLDAGGNPTRGCPGWAQARAAKRRRGAA